MSVDPDPGVPPGSPQAVGSVRSGSGFWAAGHRSGSGTSSSAFTAFSSGMSHSQHGSGGDHSGSGSGIRDSYGEYGSGMMSDIPEGRVMDPLEDADHDSQGTATENGNNGGRENGQDKKKRKEHRDEISAQDAFIAGMIYSLGQRILPGAPYTPSATPYAQVYGSSNLDLDRGRWKLEDCLRSVHLIYGPFANEENDFCAFRFASELAGRRARKRDFSGLADEMRRAGWFD